MRVANEIALALMYSEWGGLIVDARPTLWTHPCLTIECEVLEFLTQCSEIARALASWLHALLLQSQ